MKISLILFILSLNIISMFVKWCDSVASMIIWNMSLMFIISDRYPKGNSACVIINYISIHICFYSRSSCRLCSFYVSTVFTVRLFLTAVLLLFIRTYLTTSCRFMFNTRIRILIWIALLLMS